MSTRPLIGPLALAAVLLLACASGADRIPEKQETYLRWVAFEVPGNEHVLLRWKERDMPLRVYLPPPPPGIFDDPEAIHDSVRDGVLDWQDVAGPGIPRFEFVARAGDSDIPIVWAAEPDGSWYIAHCVYRVNGLQRRFDVAQVLVTGRWKDGAVADVHDVHEVMLHEMGHALGLAGHSPYPEDIMAPHRMPGREPGLTPRDRRTLAALYAKPVGARMTRARSSY
jgi:hypothetical protein